MTAAQFADEVGIQRSTLSHILNGRNKPGVDILMKIHEAYPRISVNWLMFGEGDMFDNLSGTFIASVPEQDHFQPAEENNMSAEKFGSVSEQKNQYQLSPPPKPYPVYGTEPSKKIEKIMVFYTDNTFETFSADGKTPKF